MGLKDNLISPHIPPDQTEPTQPCQPLHPYLPLASLLSSLPPGRRPAQRKCPCNEGAKRPSAKGTWARTCQAPTASAGAQPPRMAGEGVGLGPWTGGVLSPALGSSGPQTGTQPRVQDTDALQRAAGWQWDASPQPPSSCSGHQATWPGDGALGMTGTGNPARSLGVGGEGGGNVIHAQAAVSLSARQHDPQCHAPCAPFS